MFCKMKIVVSFLKIAVTLLFYDHLEIVIEKL